MKIIYEIPIEVDLAEPPVSEMPISVELDFSKFKKVEEEDLRFFSLRLFEQLPGGSTTEMPVQFSPFQIGKPVGSAIWIIKRSPLNSKHRRFTLLVELSDKPILRYPYFPRIQIFKIPYNKVSFQVDGKEVFGYCYSKDVPKPFFFPVIGPSGCPLTRIGAPDDPIPGGHDHHRSLWIEHENVNDVIFETESIEAWRAAGVEAPRIGRIIHQQILRLEDGPIFGRMIAKLKWQSHTGEVFLDEIRDVTMYSLESNERIIDFDIKLKAVTDEVKFGKSAYACLAVRVSKCLSVLYGGGCIKNSEGNTNEVQVNLKRAKWFDYSGPVTKDRTEWNGIAIFDHPSNINHPAYTIARDSGWMSCSSFYEPVTIRKGEQLRLRYRVFIHSGDSETAKIDARYQEYIRPPKISMKI